MIYLWLENENEIMLCTMEFIIIYDRYFYNRNKSLLNNKLLDI